MNLQEPQLTAKITALMSFTLLDRVRIFEKMSVSLPASRFIWETCHSADHDINIRLRFFIYLWRQSEEQEQSERVLHCFFKTDLEGFKKKCN